MVLKRDVGVSTGSIKPYLSNATTSLGKKNE
jgi:hypothetical protein